MATPPVFAHPAPRARPNAPFKSLCAFFLQISRKTARKSRKVAICAHLAAFRTFQGRKSGVLSPFRTISAPNPFKAEHTRPKRGFSVLQGHKNGVLSPFRIISTPNPSKAERARPKRGFSALLGPQKRRFEPISHHFRPKPRLKRSTHAPSAIFRPFWGHKYVPTPLASGRCPIIHSLRGVIQASNAAFHALWAQGCFRSPTGSILVSGGLRQLKTPISSPFCALCGACRCIGAPQNDFVSPLALQSVFGHLPPRLLLGVL